MFGSVVLKFASSTLAFYKPCDDYNKIPTDKLIRRGATFNCLATALYFVLPMKVGKLGKSVNPTIEFLVNTSDKVCLPHLQTNDKLHKLVF